MADTGSKQRHEVISIVSLVMYPAKNAAGHHFVQYEACVAPLVLSLQPLEWMGCAHPLQLRSVPELQDRKRRPLVTLQVTSHCVRRVQHGAERLRETLAMPQQRPPDASAGPRCSICSSTALFLCGDSQRWQYCHMQLELRCGSVGDTCKCRMYQSESTAQTPRVQTCSKKGLGCESGPQDVAARSVRPQAPRDL
jgi:hypothetical protein